MFKLIRTVRKKLLEGGKFQQYFFYALGEIFLIVIGVMIALQINNWNEYNKERTLEDEYLKKIALNVEHDILQYQKIVAAQRGYRNGIDSFLIIVRNPFTYETSALDKYYKQLWLFERFTPNKGALNNMISSGKINLIQNEELLNSILNYYKTIDEQSASVDEAISVYSRNQIGPYFMKFDFMDSKVLTPHRKRKSLLEYHMDPQIENLISARLVMMDIQNIYYNGQIETAGKLIKQIREEVKK
jgi:hypothetical protein